MKYKIGDKIKVVRLRPGWSSSLFVEMLGKTYIVVALFGETGGSGVRVGEGYTAFYNDEIELEEKHKDIKFLNFMKTTKLYHKTFQKTAKRKRLTTKK